MKQTALEWFAKELDKRHCVILNYPEYQKLFNQAKEMEKKQIIEAHEQGFYSPPVRTSRRKEAEQYYNETYKSE